MFRKYRRFTHQRARSSRLRSRLCLFLGLVTWGIVVEKIFGEHHQQLAGGAVARAYAFENGARAKLAPAAAPLMLAALSDTEPYDVLNDRPIKHQEAEISPPIDEPQEPQTGTLIGSMRLTYYWIIREEDYLLNKKIKKDTEIRSCRGELITKVSRTFAWALRMAGSGKLRDGRMLNVACKCNGRYGCFAVVNQRRFPHGVGCRNNSLLPYGSVAIDRRLIPFGAWLYAPEIDGMELPDGTRHNGCLRADDIGNRVRGMHIDWFVLNRKSYQQVIRILPPQLTIYWGGSKCQDRSEAPS
jgi:3D (Asp-Asp-Asp) domain-containing protein